MKLWLLCLAGHSALRRRETEISQSHGWCALYLYTGVGGTDGLAPTDWTAQISAEIAHIAMMSFALIYNHSPLSCRPKFNSKFTPFGWAQFDKMWCQKPGNLSPKWFLLPLKSWGKWAWKWECSECALVIRSGYKMRFSQRVGCATRRMGLNRSVHVTRTDVDNRNNFGKGIQRNGSYDSNGCLPPHKHVPHSMGKNHSTHFRTIDDRLQSHFSIRTQYISAMSHHVRHEPRIDVLSVRSIHTAVNLVRGKLKKRSAVLDFSSHLVPSDPRPGQMRAKRSNDPGYE